MIDVELVFVSHRKDGATPKDCLVLEQDGNPMYPLTVQISSLYCNEQDVVFSIEAVFDLK